MEKDIKRLKVCLEHKDYYSMLIYITIVIKNYSDLNKSFLLNILSLIKKGNYEELKKILLNY